VEYIVIPALPLRTGDHTVEAATTAIGEQATRLRERERRERCEIATPRGTLTGASSSGVAGERVVGGYAAAAAAGGFRFPPCGPEGATRLLAVLLDGLELNGWTSTTL
jgi:hypothetical protein